MKYGPQLSMVVPCYNEEEVLPLTYERLSSVCHNAVGAHYELVFVNDGSNDDTLKVLTALHQHDNHVKIVSFSRNFGHEMALTAGIDHATGQLVGVIDADLQDPPETISQMVELLQSEPSVDVVYGVRRSRSSDGFLKRLTAAVFYGILNKMTNGAVPRQAGDFRVMRRKVVDSIRAYREESRFMRGIFATAGFNQVAVEFDRAERAAGATKYGIPQLLHLSLDAILSFSSAPLRVAWNLGLFSVVVSLLLLAYAFVGRFTGAVSGWASTIAVIVFFGGTQLFTIGIIGEYVGRIYIEVKNRPLYIIDEVVGFQDKSPGSA